MSIFASTCEHFRIVAFKENALKLVQNNKTTYVARSRCYMEMGKIRKAMNDALFQKGELLFQEKNFESALVYYNKGMQQRPEMKSFHDRITKTQNAMLKTGSKLTNKLIKSGELSMVLPNKI
ncbi:hypothetical protein KUTeg_008913 [Tegillarca granosa]|uniref:Outer dynein arm-docking complex subunit 4 n=1 Tax=Tegillarca granosa TaxID=220873 RepID=A0ABQ9FEU1_TEGGR|nr:hypothetical protein KUTeg_008913 [Tegillarca granosa]